LSGPRLSPKGREAKQRYENRDRPKKEGGTEWKRRLPEGKESGLKRKRNLSSFGEKQGRPPNSKNDGAGRGKVKRKGVVPSASKGKQEGQSRKLSSYRTIGDMKMSQREGTGFVEKKGERFNAQEPLLKAEDFRGMGWPRLKGEHFC